MRKLLQQFVACYLVLSVAAGGVVALSPVFHVWVEHGGHAASHIHHGLWHKFSAHSHPHGVHFDHPPVHRHGQKSNQVAAESHPKQSFEHNHGASWQPVLAAIGHSLHALMHLLEHLVADDTNPTDHGEDSDHQHHSLPQLLASGLIEQHLDLPLLSPVQISAKGSGFPAHIVLIPRDWDAQTAGRGPPPHPS